MKIAPPIKIFFFLIFIFTSVLFLYGRVDVLPIMKAYKDYPLEILLEKGKKYREEGKSDSALIIFGLIEQRFCSIGEKEIWDKEDIERIIIALQTSAQIYFYFCNYDKALELFLKALSIAEKSNYSQSLTPIYNGIGNVHSAFKDYEVSKKYYLKAYEYARDKHTLSATYNNVGTVYICLEEYDSAVGFLEKAYLLMKEQNSVYYKPLSNLGLAYHRRYLFKEALVYYKKALHAAIENNAYEGQASVISNIGQLYYDMGNYDTAHLYLSRSNGIAHKNGHLLSVIDNYKYLSFIEERRKNYQKSLEYDRCYVRLNDSIYHISVYSGINQKQFMFDMSKIDNQMKVLSAEYALKENKILMQRRIQVVMILIIISVVVFLVILFKKNHTLHKAYAKLVEKNMEMVKIEESYRWLKKKYEGLQSTAKTFLFQNTEHEVEESKSFKKNHPLSSESRIRLLDAIEKFMEHSEIFCDSDFSLELLAEKVHSNSNYVSHVINECYGKNFRTFINEYRIKEAVRMLSLPEYAKYSLETISEMVGFKSKTTFYKLFLKIVGVTPSFYLKSIQLKSK